MKKNASYLKAPLILAATVSLALASTANAASNLHRDDCLSMARAGGRGRQMGVRNAQRLFNAIWSKMGRTCDKIDQLGTIIADTPLSRPMMGGEFAACFYQGYTDTLWNQLSDAYDRCQIRCFNAGTQVGQISAEGYCAASIAVGGLDDPGFIEQPPLPFCGENLVLGCKSQYIQSATSEIQGCYAYTTGSYETTFDDSVRQDCFVPSDVPIRDDLRMADGSTINLAAGVSVATLF
jgi:hypothetical protein